MKLRFGVTISKIKHRPRTSLISPHPARRHALLSFPRKSGLGPAKDPSSVIDIHPGCPALWAKPARRSIAHPPKVGRRQMTDGILCWGSRMRRECIRNFGVCAASRTHLLDMTVIFVVLVYVRVNIRRYWKPVLTWEDGIDTKDCKCNSFLQRSVYIILIIILLQTSYKRTTRWKSSKSHEIRIRKTRPQLPVRLITRKLSITSPKPHGTDISDPKLQCHRSFHQGYKSPVLAKTDY